jgi:hypothetical protein
MTDVNCPTRFPLDDFLRDLFLKFLWGHFGLLGVVIWTDAAAVHVSDVLAREPLTAQVALTVPVLASLVHSSVDVHVALGAEQLMAQVASEKV